MDALTQGFELEGLQVAPLTGEVSGPGGVVKLDPKVMEVLVLIARNPGQVVPREDLMTRLWGPAVVTDDALTRCFYELRRHLVRAGGNERCRDIIETLPKRGYRLNATVRPSTIAQAPAPVPPSAPPASTRSPWRIVAALAAPLIAVVAGLYLLRSSDSGESPGAGATVHSIAVLPFLDMSEGKDQRYLADGVTEEILNHLAQARNLRVIARTSSFTLRGSTMDIKGIGKRLDVEYVLEGSVRRSGDRMRITAQLIEVASNAHIWSRTYDRTLDDLFAVQDEIAESVGTALQAELTDPVSRLAAQPSFEAYENYLRGQFHYHRRAPGDIDRAIQFYRRAVEVDPRFARAWAALAGAYSLAKDATNFGDKDWEPQGAAARKAVALDPELAVAQARLAQYYQRTGQRALASQHFQKAVQLDPDDPLVLGFSSTRAVYRGDMQAAIDIWRRLVAMDPLSAMYRHNLGNFLLVAGDTKEAVVELRTAVELNPDGSDNQLDLARALILAGDTTEAAALIASVPPGPTRDLAFALLVHDPQHESAARSTLARLEASRSDIRLTVRVAEAHAYQGDTESAFRVLTAAHAESERRQAEAPVLRMYLREEMIMAAFLKPLHKDPLWATLTAPTPPEA